MVTTPGLQSFGIKKLKQLKFIENIDIELTNKCNFNCIYCYVKRDKTTHLKVSLLETILKYCEKNDVKNITLTGGEPFLYKNFDYLIHLIENTDINITFFTNGSFLKNVIKEYDFSQISICLKRDCLSDGLQALVCGINQMPYNFFDLINSIKKEVKELTVHSALTAMNYKELPQLYKILKNMGIPHYISRVVPSKETIKKIIPTKEMCKEVFSSIAKINGKELTIPFAGDVGCIKMYCSIFIDRFGTIYPCSNLPIIVGKVNETKLKIEKQKLKIFRNIDKEIKGKCKICPYLSRCYGCRGIAFHITGDYLAGDPLCWRK